jgi:anti-sigma factor RsiW
MTPFVDGSLPAEERAAVERHLDSCPPCQRAAAEAMGGRAVLRSAASRLPADSPPPGLRSRCEALARHHRAPAAASWIQRLAPVAASAGIILATALIVFGLASRQSNVLLAQQLTLDHVKCFRLFADPEAHVDPHVAEEALAGYGWHVRVPPSSTANGVTFVGARRCLYTSGTIPHMMYTLDGEELSLFVLPGEQRENAEFETLGHRSRIWSDGDATYVLVAPRESDTLGQAATYLMQQQEQTR